MWQSEAAGLYATEIAPNLEVANALDIPQYQFLISNLAHPRGALEI